MRRVPLVGLLAIATMACGLSAGCGYTRHQFGRPYQMIEVEPGKTTRTQILEAMGAPQLFDCTAAGDLGKNFLVYEFRDSRTWVISPIIVNYGDNTEETDTAVFYFDNAGVLESVGSSRQTPTTHRTAFTILFPFAIGELMK